MNKKPITTIEECMKEMTSRESTIAAINELIEFEKKKWYEELESYVAMAQTPEPTYDTFLDGMNRAYQNILEDFKPKS